MGADASHLQATTGGPVGEGRIVELIQALGRPDWRPAASKLTAIGEPALPALIRVLDDRVTQTWIVQARSIEVLAQIGGPAPVEALTKFLQNTRAHANARGVAALKLAELDSKTSVSALADALGDDSQFVRWKSAQALGIVGHTSGADALLLALCDSDKYVRAAAARSLGIIKAGHAAPGLIEALNDVDWAVRRNAREALLNLGESPLTDLMTALGNEHPQIRWQAAWVLGQIRSEAAVEPLAEALDDPEWMVRDQAAASLCRIHSPTRSNSLVAPHVATLAAGPPPAPDLVKQIRYRGEDYPCHPMRCSNRPDVPSPLTADDGREVVLGALTNGTHLLIPVSIENGTPLNYARGQWGKGRQLEVDVDDFPTLASTGLHSDLELDQTKLITGRSVAEVTELGRPNRLSGAGFMGPEEDLISVLKADNRLLMRLGLTHPQLATPLFHVWNILLRDREVDRAQRTWSELECIWYNGRRVNLDGQGTRGWQESLFDDEILGMHQFDIASELTSEEKAFLKRKYAHLDDREMGFLQSRLTSIHTGEMVPYYIRRYGFYEGHTDYRADPIAIAWIFGLRTLEQIEAAFPRRLDKVLGQAFTRE